jgi:IclR family acetate operon transcriptional repressor
LREAKDTSATPKRARRSVQSVDRALDLLEALAAAEGEVSITALAARTSLHVSTVHRLLSTLLRRGYVRQNPETSRYYAGAKLATLSEGRSRFGELRLRVRPVLRSITEATRDREPVVLATWPRSYRDGPGPQVVRLPTGGQLRAPARDRAARFFSPRSRRRAATASSTGSSPLAHRTIVDPPQLRHALEEMRRGYAIDDGDDGVRCVAVGHGGPNELIGAIDIGAANRLARQLHQLVHSQVPRRTHCRGARSEPSA